MKEYEFEKEINGLIRDINEDTPGLSLLVGKKDGILYTESWGMADVENKIPVSCNTNFLIASISKQFTCMAIMMLKERGLLDYDEPISEFFPYFPEYKNVVTIRHLMTHTSGIKEYFTDEVFRLENLSKNLSQEDVLEMINSFGDLEFRPGSMYSYCNSAYVMLGVIIEKLSETSLASFLAENIFKPVGMADTFVCTTPEQAPKNLAKGYKTVDGKFIRKKLDMIAVSWADGNIISTVKDLFKWNRVLYTESLVKRKTIHEAFTPYLLTDGSTTDYGFGWHIDSFKGRKQVWHTGTTIGYIAKMSRLLDEEVVVIMLANNMNLDRDNIISYALNSIL